MARPTPVTATSPTDIPPNATERTDLRTATSRTYELADGRMVTQLFDKPIFYRADGGSTWQPVDTTLRVPSDRSSTLSADRAPARLALNAAGSAAGFIRLTGGGRTIGIGLPTSQRSVRTALQPVAQAGGSYAEYSGFLGSVVNLRVFPETDGYTMFLVLNAQPASNVFTFTIDAPGLTLGPDPLGTPGAVAFTDAAGNIVGDMPRPFMQDSSYVEGRGGGLYSEAVSQSYAGSAGQWQLTLTVDPAFLASATYPVYVDPSVTSFPNASATAQDTFASSKYPGSNFNTYQRPDSPYYHEMWLGNEPGTSYYNQVFLRFKDIDTVLGEVAIDSAYLEFYPYWQYWHTDPRQSWLKRITGTWQQNQLTWNNRPTVESTDYMSFFTTQGSSSHVDVTGYVQDVVDGDWVNNGFQLNVDSQGQGGWKRIVSLDDSNTSLVPHLDVTWHVPTIPPVVVAVWPDNEWMEDDPTFEWTYDDGDGNPSTTGTQAAFQVQVNTSSSFGATTMLADSGIINTSVSTWALPGAVTLTDGQDYYWRVRVNDGTSWSVWYQTSLYWDTTQLSTGVNETNDDVNSPSDLGLTQAEIDQANTEFEAYLLNPESMGVDYPDRCDLEGGPCTTPPPIPSEKHLPDDGFDIFHQKDGIWCVLATVESILNWKLSTGGWASPSVYATQLRMSQYHTDTFDWQWVPTGPHAGTGTNKGLKYLNIQLHDAGVRKYVPETMTPGGSLARFESYIKADIYNRDRPLFARIQLLGADGIGAHGFYPYHNHSRSEAHATLIVGYSDNGGLIDVADPYPSQACEPRPWTNWSSAPDYGCVYQGSSALDTFKFLPILDTTDRPSNQLWY